MAQASARPPAEAGLKQSVTGQAERSDSAEEPATVRTLSALGPMALSQHGSGWAVKHRGGLTPSTT
jgi:hypothetical protein